MSHKPKVYRSLFRLNTLLTYHRIVATQVNRSFQCRNKRIESIQWRGMYSKRQQKLDWEHALRSELRMHQRSVETLKDHLQTECKFFALNANQQRIPIQLMMMIMMVILSFLITLSLFPSANGSLLKTMLLRQLNAFECDTQKKKKKWCRIVNDSNW